MKKSTADVLLKPETFFADLMRKHESLKVPLLILIAAGIVSAASAYMASGPGVKMLAGLMPGMESIIIVSTIVFSLVAILIFWIIWSGVFYALSFFFKGKGTFKRVLECVGYGYLPQIFSSLIILIISFFYIPQVKVPQLSASALQNPQIIQDATKALMHDPAMMAFTQITSIISIVFLLLSANIWIFGIRSARTLQLRDAAICVGVPVVGYIFYIIYTLTVI
jgi:hypothetical protein